MEYGEGKQWERRQAVSLLLKETGICMPGAVIGQASGAAESLLSFQPGSSGNCFMFVKAPLGAKAELIIGKEGQK